MRSTDGQGEYTLSVVNDLDSGSFGTNDSKAVLMGRVWLFRYSDDIEVIDGLMETIKGRGRDVIPAPARGETREAFQAHKRDGYQVPYNNSIDGWKRARRFLYRSRRRSCLVGNHAYYAAMQVFDNGGKHVGAWLSSQGTSPKCQR